MRFFLKSLFSIHPTFLTLSTILVVIILFLSGVSILDLIELKTYDLRILSRGPLRPSPEVVLATIDEKSIETEGRWPWPRSKFAALVDLLSRDGARVIGFDIGFLEPDENAQNDQALANTIKHSSAAVVLGYFFHMNEANLGYLIKQQEIDQQLKRIKDSKYPLILYRERATGFGPFFRAHAPKSNLAMFTEAAVSSGYFNLGSDQDGVIRWMPLMIQGGEDLFPPLAVLCAWHYLGKSQLIVRVGRYGVESVQMGDRFIPTDEIGRLLINYLGPAKTFPRFSVSDILSGKLVRGTFTDKIVLVGTTDEIESEGFDRSTLSLAGRQDELVTRIAAVNPRTVVVVNAGAPVIMPWAQQVAAVVWAWLPGQEGGDVLADVLLGLAEPGGRLPTSLPAAEADCPVLSTTPVHGTLDYAEADLIGYRAYAAAGIQPAFPFGHGLGYTTCVIAWRPLAKTSMTERSRKTSSLSGSPSPSCSGALCSETRSRTGTQNSFVAESKPGTLSGLNMIAGTETGPAMEDCAKSMTSCCRSGS